MKALLTCLIFSVLVSIFAYTCMTEQAKNAYMVTYVNPIGVVLGFVIAFQGVLQSKKYEGLLGLVQLSFWSLYGFFFGLKMLAPPSTPLQILLVTLITVYLAANLVLFALAFYHSRFGKAASDAAS
jgi:hypothetical protein